jgi:hypothetical protein
VAAVRGRAGGGDVRKGGGATAVVGEGVCRKGTALSGAARAARA